MSNVKKTVIILAYRSIYWNHNIATKSNFFKASKFLLFIQTGVSSVLKCLTYIIRLFLFLCLNETLNHLSCCVQSAIGFWQTINNKFYKNNYFEFLFIWYFLFQKSLCGRFLAVVGWLQYVPFEYEFLFLFLGLTRFFRFCLRWSLQNKYLFTCRYI